MTDQQSYGRFCVTDEDLVGITTEKARDLIIKCFFEAQKETIHRSKDSLKLPSSDEEVMDSITLMIKQVFRETGGDFDHPTKEQLAAVVESLAKKSYAWGTPEDIIEHHKGQIGQLLQSIE